ncbi:MAG: AAA family ATPase [Thermoleophilia bacterium]
MRIHRISLREFRGVENLEVEFDVTGVTIVEGRNEIGKTSIADAFLHLLDMKDSSAATKVKEMQPIGRDVGPFVEAGFAVGPYQLVYRKRWLKDRLTELDIAAPAPEQLTGEAAHNRVIQILEECTDTDLFRALRYQQGFEISQASIGDAQSLVAALDAVAGGAGSGTGAGEGHDALFDRVGAERLLFFTPRGQVTVARKARAEQLIALEGQSRGIEDQIRGLEETADRVRQIDLELLGLRAEAPSAAEQIVVHTRNVREIEGLEHRLELSRLSYDAATAKQREAVAARDSRTVLVKAATDAANLLVTLDEAARMAAPGLEEARASLAREALAHETAKTALASAEQDALTIHQVVELLDLRLERDQLGERLGRASAAEGAIRAAEGFLAGCTLTDGLAREIDEAAKLHLVAKVRAEAGSPHLVIDVLRPIDVTVNGRARDVAPGSPLEETVSTEVEIVIGDVARISVSRPASPDGAVDDLAEATRRLDGLLAQGGVTSVADAHELGRERLRQETERASERRRRTDALRDLETPELEAKLGRAEERVTVLEADGAAAGTEGETLDEARVLANAADDRMRAARIHGEHCQTGERAAEAALRLFEDTELKRTIRLADATAEAERSAHALGEQRAVSGDDGLETALRESEAAVVAEETKRLDAEQSLTEGDPGTARALLENATGLQERIMRDIQAREIAGAEARAILGMVGHEGLADGLATVLAEQEELLRDVNAENRRAAAVELLHDLLVVKRQAAQLAYVGPFRDKINGYARIIFGHGVEVEVDPSTLEIVSRTLNGTTVPFALLSGGAREQFCVLARLACAALVSPASADGTPGGVPVIIDDALGYSDPGRLEALGAAFTAAGRDCQVIVLTCEPGRYRGIGGAKTMTLG